MHLPLSVSDLPADQHALWYAAWQQGQHLQPFTGYWIAKEGARSAPFVQALAHWRCAEHEVGLLWRRGLCYPEAYFNFLQRWRCPPLLLHEPCHTTRWAEVWVPAVCAGVLELSPWPGSR